MLRCSNMCVSLNLAESPCICAECEIVSKCVRELPPVMVFDGTEDRNWAPKLGLSYGAVFVDSVAPKSQLISI